MTPLLLLYDASCSVCRLLASILRSDSPADWQIISWQDYHFAEGDTLGMDRAAGPSELSLQWKGTWYEGEGAWRILLQEQPRLRAFQDLAARIGLGPPLHARWLRRLAHGIRSLCPSCPGVRARNRLR